MTRDEALKLLWSKGNINTISKTECDDIIKQIYDDFESRTCESCKYGKERNWDWDTGRHNINKSYECQKLNNSGQITPYSKYQEDKFYCSPYFGCNKWEDKQCV